MATSETIAQLQTGVANLQAEVNVDLLSNPGAIPGLLAQISLDNQNLLTLEALCFAHGTHILTDRGEVLVEDLAIGDLVVTPGAKAECMPIRWISRQHYEGLRAHAGQPIQIRAGALGEDLPLRDLRVSGDHCLLLDGHLVPAKLLVNGVTIVAETGHTLIDYVNIELDQHQAVLAEGVETEDYLDCGNRDRFDNANESSEWLATRTARGQAAWHNGTACAPTLWDGPKLDALRARLAGKDASATVERPVSQMTADVAIAA
jgi:hypothetical protein